MRVNLPNGVLNVVIHHNRPDLQEHNILDCGMDMNWKNFSPNTECVIVFPNGATVNGHSWCRWPDQFVRFKGATKALAKALNQTNLGKTERRMIYQQLFGSICK